ncbi:MAG: hypothetical protein HYU88_05680 [Chloroflexi bacterium]|nr:hypothetical protein [Chloroflexota bacterium]MBI4503892.1 hypothetical protein [Chloroflexota bacterium]
MSNVNRPWRAPWRYCMVMDFGPDEDAGERCALCGRRVRRWTVMLLDNLRARHHFGLTCAATLLCPAGASRQHVLRRIAELRRWANRGSIPTPPPDAPLPPPAAPP